MAKSRVAIAVLALTAFWAAGCQQLDTAIGNQQAQFRRTCAYVQPAHAVFLSVIVVRSVSEQVMRAEAQAYAAATAICALPPSDVLSALAAASAAYAAMLGVHVRAR